MCGTDTKNKSLFNNVNLEKRFCAHHPMRVIQLVMNDALPSLLTDFGHHSISPERLVRAGPVLIFYSDVIAVALCSFFSINPKKKDRVFLEFTRPFTLRYEIQTFSLTFLILRAGTPA